MIGTDSDQPLASHGHVTHARLDFACRADWAAGTSHRLAGRRRRLRRRPRKVAAFGSESAPRPGVGPPRSTLAAHVKRASRQAEEGRRAVALSHLWGSTRGPRPVDRAGGRPGVCPRGSLSFAASGPRRARARVRVKQGPAPDTVRVTCPLRPPRRD